MIKELTVRDLASVARIHQLAFPRSALSALGLEGIRRYYSWQMSGPHEARCIGAFEHDELLGFCFGGVFHGALSGFLRKNRDYLLLRLLTHPWLALSPLVRDRVRLAWASLNKRPASKAPHVVVPARSFGILAIAVHPHGQGRGYGGQLMSAAERTAVERGFPHMHLTVAVDNLQAVSFYEGLGWQKRPSADGLWHGAMIKQLGSLANSVSD